MFRKKHKAITYNADLAMKMAECADRDLRFGGSEEDHDRSILAIADIAKLYERLEEIEKYVRR